MEDLLPLQEPVNASGSRSPQPCVVWRVCPAPPASTPWGNTTGQGRARQAAARPEVPQPIRGLQGHHMTSARVYFPHPPQAVGAMLGHGGCMGQRKGICHLAHGVSLGWPQVCIQQPGSHSTGKCSYGGWFQPWLSALFCRAHSLKLWGPAFLIIWYVLLLLHCPCHFIYLCYKLIQRTVTQKCRFLQEQKPNKLTYSAVGCEAAVSEMLC